MSRAAIALSLPPEEAVPVAQALEEAGFTVLPAPTPDALAALLAQRKDIAVAVLDSEHEFDASLESYGLLHERGRDIPALMVVSSQALEQLEAGAGSASDEYLTRPYSAESLRWRIEAMCIRFETVDDGSGPVIQSGRFDPAVWGRRATIIAIFNPKGGVGKTTVATNLAAALQRRPGQRVMLVDADTVTGHVTTSLGLEQVRTVADSWRDELEGGDPEPLADISSVHPSGLRVLALTSSPLTTELLDPDRVGDAIEACRRDFDFIVVDLHPSYSNLNRAIFDRADRLLVPVTPDVPAIRAAVQMRDVATELGIRERLSMVVNRANSGVSVADMERTVGMPALTLIRSGGMVLVKAANEGRTVADMFPKEAITADFDRLADRMLGIAEEKAASRLPFRLWGRSKEPVRV